MKRIRPFEESDIKNYAPPMTKDCEGRCDREVVITKTGPIIICDACKRVVMDNREKPDIKKFEEMNFFKWDKPKCKKLNYIGIDSKSDPVRMEEGSPIKDICLWYAVTKNITTEESSRILNDMDQGEYFNISSEWIKYLNSDDFKNNWNL